MLRRFLAPALAGLLLLLAALACAREPAGPVIIVTATPLPDDPLIIATREDQPDNAPAATLTPPPTPAALIVPTLDPPRLTTPEPLPASYVVQPGDNLSAIADRFGVTLARLIELNAIADPSLLSVGQVLDLPELSEIFGPAFKLIPDSELVRGPASGGFDIAGYIGGLPGYLRTYSEERDGRRLTGADVVQRVVDEYSVNPRLLLALLEHRAGWLSDPEPDPATLLYPLGYGQLAYEGLYMQLAWTANRLNEAYYGWRLRGELWFTFDDGVRVAYAPGMNAGTVAVQYMLSRNSSYDAWLQDVAQAGFYNTYVTLFGDPFAYAIEPLLPANLTQPPLQLPFPQGETWYYTGGPHGGFGTGSGWAAIDFAPPGDENTAGCFVASQWATAVADGLVARSGDGFVILDLDGDGDETTGWTIVYLHLASEGRVAAGTRVQAGDPLGHPSCEGGVSNATHLHLARRYNGEWITAQCHACAPGLVDIPLVLGGWTVRGLEGQEYQGYMISGEAYRQAEQGRTTPINELSW